MPEVGDVTEIYYLLLRETGYPLVKIDGSTPGANINFIIDRDSAREILQQHGGDPAWLDALPDEDFRQPPGAPLPEPAPSAPAQSVDECERL